MLVNGFGQFGIKKERICLSQHVNKQRGNNGNNIIGLLPQKLMSGSNSVERKGALFCYVFYFIIFPQIRNWIS